MIPKKIHYCWLSDEPLPTINLHCLNSWKENLNDYELVLWDKKKFDINSSRWVKESYEAKKYAFSADFIRLYALYTEGGIYLDLDVEVINTFDSFLDLKSFIGFDPSGSIEAAVIGAEKNTSWIKASMDYYLDKSFYSEKGKASTVPLPIIIEAALKKKYSIRSDLSNLKNINNELNLYPYYFFSPKDPRTGKMYTNNQTVCIHHFEGSWLSKRFFFRLKKNIHISLTFIFGLGLHNKIIKSIKNFLQ